MGRGPVSGYGCCTWWPDTFTDGSRLSSMQGGGRRAVLFFFLQKGRRCVHPTRFDLLLFAISHRSYFDYTVWNTSVLTVTLAGNSTVSVATSVCPREGCEGPAISRVTSEAVFRWSDNASWLALNASVPCDHDPAITLAGGGITDFPDGSNCADVTIWEGWTVILDVETPFLNRLAIRGSLVADNRPNVSIGIHANLVDVKGGRLVIGNETAPFIGRRAHVTLHGDMYFHGKGKRAPLELVVGRRTCHGTGRGSSKAIASLRHHPLLRLLELVFSRLTTEDSAWHGRVHAAH